MKHNNVIASAHMRKHWQMRVRTFFNQAAKKKRRLLKRRERAKQLFPRPLEQLRPEVHSQTIRYNKKLRLGRGFSLLELKEAGLSAQFARSIGIAVDHRRKNRCQESFDANKQRLINYKQKLVLYPRGKVAKKGLINDTNLEEIDKIHVDQNTEPVLVRARPQVKREQALKISKDMQSAKIFQTIRQEWAWQRWEGKRQKKLKEAEDRK